ncbi:DUF1707 SHOCT-like domain-containing protein [Enemella dayhoffiae]|uniref:DUF1707 SHOCT-like domain-containing protein n=1 Tax=Enemella dayhoffiae TaxID=2016507 RepID=UPI00159619B0|nr:DUF1707 domain-containing protein [Enemella dayhoffiae]
MTDLNPLPERLGAAWSRFRVDPRNSDELRAADRDRDVAREVLAEAYADGQLDHDEYLSRLDRASATTRMSELVPLVGDLSVGPGGARTEQPTAEPARRTGLDNAWMSVGASWVFVAIVTNVIWLITSISTGEMLHYWPVWPMMGVGFGVLATWMTRRSVQRNRRELGR